MDWRDRAKCRSKAKSIWFSPDRGSMSPDQEAYAKGICNNACPVTAQCLEWALQQAIPCGIFGGTTPAERNEIRQARVLAGTAASGDLIAAPYTRRGKTSNAGTVVWHVMVDGFPACGHTSPDVSKAIPAREVPDAKRCTAAGCKHRFRRLDETQLEVA
ncbi:WhiB family transcriptional regulator [Kutzneria albida]|uniref:Transcriptional regulator WhiB n=1 Tax=Kutzneria albida DSM 43870 TaxID=1449976 RepID=W5WBL6_9PSEU|nr:WhiB family transcriptional regulator [Kutzneria albida]AHH98262.1 hypothetical protein KALB_4900 [Kutzneria albida DSM 43870]